MISLNPIRRLCLYRQPSFPVLSSSCSAPTLAALLSVSLLVGCSDREVPVIRDDVRLTNSLDLFEQPILPDEQQQPVGTTVAVVNGAPIRLEQLQREANALALRLRSRMPPEQIESRRDNIMQQALTQLIHQRLLLENAASLDIEIPNQQIDQALENVVAGLPENATLDTFLTRSGLTEEALRENIRMELAVQQMLRSRIQPQEEPTEEALKQVYDENINQMMVPERMRAQQIVSRKSEPPAADPQAEERAGKLKFRMIAGTSIEALLVEFEEDPQIDGGSVVFARGQIPEVLETALFALSPNEISEVTESSAGYHIFEAQERLPPEQLPFEQAREELSRLLLQQTAQQRMNEYLAQLREQADIEILIGSDVQPTPAEASE